MKRKESLEGYCNCDWWLYWVNHSKKRCKVGSASAIFKIKKSGHNKDGSPFAHPVKVRITIEEI